MGKWSVQPYLDSDIPEPTYQIQFKTRSRVGYCPQEDAIVEYWFERDYVFYTCPPKMGTNLGVCPIENFNVDRLVPICEL